jgi:phosphoglucomutase
MNVHPLAGKTAPQSFLTNIPRLIADYYLLKPDVEANPQQKVSFGTSGHRGSSQTCSFNENHLLAIAQAICEHRHSKGIKGPLFLGMDTHALSEPAFCSVVEVFVANNVNIVVQQDRGYTPTPVISHAILLHNRHNRDNLSDGVVITPSHNPPEDGGLKYNGADGGPADTDVTGWIQDRANELLKSGLAQVKRLSFEQAINAPQVTVRDFAIEYVNDLASIIDMEAISKAKIKIGIDPLGGSGIHYWDVIAAKYNLDIELVNDIIDPTFSFMSIDKDGKIRMDCSSKYCMTRLIELKDKYDVSIGNDPDYDRHGIVTKKGLLNPNHYLAVSIHYLFSHRKLWSAKTRIGKTLVSSSMIDRVVADLEREVFEVPVGFKWFVKGMNEGTLGFGGEESAGACFLKKDGSTWATDKDGIIMGLLAAEIMAVTGKDPEELYQELVAKHGEPLYKRIDAPASVVQKALLKSLDKSAITAKTLAGEDILQVHSHAPGNNQSIGGLKIVTENGWFAARPSGTEEIYKIYMESFKGEAHLEQIELEALAIVDGVFGA